MLIQCPECLREVSDKAAACPHCGARQRTVGPRVAALARRLAAHPFLDPNRARKAALSVARTIARAALFLLFLYVSGSIYGWVATSAQGRAETMVAACLMLPLLSTVPMLFVINALWGPDLRRGLRWLLAVFFLLSTVSYFPALRGYSFDLAYRATIWTIRIVWTTVLLCALRAPSSDDSRAGWAPEISFVAMAIVVAAFDVMVWATSPTARSGKPAAGPVRKTVPESPVMEPTRHELGEHAVGAGRMTVGTAPVLDRGLAETEQRTPALSDEEREAAARLSRAVHLDHNATDFEYGAGAHQIAKIVLGIDSVDGAVFNDGKPLDGKTYHAKMVGMLQKGLASLDTEEAKEWDALGDDMEARYKHAVSKKGWWQRNVAEPVSEAVEDIKGWVPTGADYANAPEEIRAAADRAAALKVQTLGPRPDYDPQQAIADRKALDAYHDQLRKRDTIAAYDAKIRAGRVWHHYLMVRDELTDEADGIVQTALHAGGMSPTDFRRFRALEPDQQRMVAALVHDAQPRESDNVLVAAGKEFARQLVSMPYDAMEHLSWTFARQFMEDDRYQEMARTKALLAEATAPRVRDYGSWGNRLVDAAAAVPHMPWAGAPCDRPESPVRDPRPYATRRMAGGEGGLAAPATKAGRRPEDWGRLARDLALPEPWRPPESLWNPGVPTSRARVRAARLGTGSVPAADPVTGDTGEPTTRRVSGAEIRAFAAGRRARFSTTGHPKANGVDLSIDYPLSWAAEEGRRPNIVQRFEGRGPDGILLQGMLAVNDVPYGSGLDGQGGGGGEFARQLVADVAGQYIDGGTTRLEGGTAIWADFSLRSERAGMSVATYNRMLVTVVEKKLVVLHFVVGGPRDTASLEHAFAEYRPLFDLMANSLVFRDRWASSPTPSPQSPRNTADTTASAARAGAKRVELRGCLSLEVPAEFRVSAEHEDYLEIGDAEGLPTVFVRAYPASSSASALPGLGDDKAKALETYRAEQLRIEAVKTQQLRDSGVQSEVVKWHAPYPLEHLEQPAYGIEFVRRDTLNAMGRAMRVETYCVNIQVIHAARMYDINIRHIREPEVASPNAGLPAQLVGIISSISFR